ncbi:MAG: cysteine desulfurase family protein [Pseudomonadota bacterium]|nr:cysteine desulfurase family protein [Pseudomonadota bacterium]
MIYLDHNATSPLCDAALEAMMPWFGIPTNPFSAHRYGRAAAAAVDRARGQVAALAGWTRDGVYFTSGATEANNTVLSRGRWMVSAVEHPSVYVWADAFLGVDECGRVRLEELAAPGALDGFDGLSVMLANNETGVIAPIVEIAKIARGAGVLLHVDASQAPGRIPMRIAADFVTLSAHKFGGPQGMGALLVRAGLSPEPLLRGGPQERGRRAGTPNVAGIVGMGAAAAATFPAMSPARRDRLERALVAIGGRVAGAGADRLPNTTAVAFDGIEAADLVMALDLEGVAVSAGSACSSGAAEPSHVLRAMGFAGSAVRFSLDAGTSDADVDEAAAAVARVLARLP